MLFWNYTEDDMNRIKRSVSTKTTNLHDPIRYKSWNISCGRPYVSMNMYIGFYWALDTSVCFDLFCVSVKCDIGWSIKKYSIKVKKKCTKNWRWPIRELKTWHMYNNTMVFLYAKRYFSYFDLYSWYGHLNVKFWQFWHSPNVLKFCSKIVFCL